MVHHRDLLGLVRHRTGSRSLVSDPGSTIRNALWWALHGMSKLRRDRRGLTKHRGAIAHELASHGATLCDGVLRGASDIARTCCMALGGMKHAWIRSMKGVLRVRKRVFIETIEIIEIPSFPGSLIEEA